MRRCAAGAAAALLAACASAPTAQRPPAVPAPLPQPARSASAPIKVAEAPVLPAAGSGRGAYYQDDGPGAAPPSGLLELPDADVRNEPFSTRANRPYVVFGKTYTPQLDEQPLVQRGVGSWYGKKFHGQRTASGELYDMYKMTAAHPTLPIPSYARVTSLVSGKQVIVRINDRGPFHAGRVVDLSYTAALKLGLLSAGSHEVEVARLLPTEIDRMVAARRGEAPRRPLPEPVMTQLALVPAQVEALMLGEVALPDEPLQAAPSMVPAAPGAPLAGGAAAPIDLKGAPAAGYYLQFGAFSGADKAEAARASLLQSGGVAGTLDVVQSGQLHRLFSGPYASRALANEAAQALPAALSLKPIVVQR
ncbi:MAG: septal ring lytic transglycosylase RlpA family protein [Pseudomonadota bacterium]